MSSSIVPAHIDIGEVTRGLRSAVHGEVLGRGDGLVVVRIVALHSRHKRNSHAAAQERILAIGLLASSPARIAKDVDVGSPEVQALEDVGVAGALGLDVLDPAFDADRGRHGVNAGGIECRREADGLRKLGRAVDRDTVERFAPPVIGGNAQAWDRPGLVDELRGLFLQRHPMYQIGCTLLRGEREILVRWRDGLLRARAGCREEEAGQGRRQQARCPPDICRRRRVTDRVCARI